MGRIILSICAIITLSSLCPPQRSSQTSKKALSAPTLDQILDRYEAAIGGREAWDKLRTRVVKGIFVYSPPGTSGNTETYQEFPDKYLGITVAPTGGKVEAGLNGQVGWSKDPVRGLRRLIGSELTAAKLQGAFNAEIRMRELFPQMELVSANRTGNRMLYVVRATSTDGVAATMYFDSQSGLMARMTWVDVSGQLVDEHIDEYCELRDVGIKYPCKQRMIYPKLTISYRITEIHHNVAIDESLFSSPSFEYKIQR